MDALVRWAMSRRRAKDWDALRRCLTTSSTVTSRCPYLVTPLFSGHCCQVIILNTELLIMPTPVLPSKNTAIIVTHILSD